MVFGISYHVVGRADCPYFARAERLAQHPSLWSSHLSTLCQKLGFGAHLLSQEKIQAPDQVLIYNQRTKRLIGGEKAFRKEVKAKYDLECDISWALLQSIARENLDGFERQKLAEEQRKKAQPLIVAILGPIGSGASTLARKVQQVYGLIRISTGELLREAIRGSDKSSSSSAAAGTDGPAISETDRSTIKNALLAGELVPDSILLPLISHRLRSTDIRLAGGAVLVGFPRTAKQAHALLDLGKEVGELQRVFRLEGLSSSELSNRQTERRIDPVTGEIYHLQNVVPQDAMILSRLEKRLEDASSGGDSSASAAQIHARWRTWEQNHLHFFAVFPKSIVTVVRTDSGKQPQGLFDELATHLEPLVTASRLSHTEAKAAEVAGLKRAAENAALLSPVPVAVSPVVTARPSPKDPEASPPASSPVPVTPDMVADGVKATMPLSRRASMEHKEQLARAAMMEMREKEAARLAAEKIAAGGGSRRGSGSTNDGQSVAVPIVAAGAGSRRASLNGNRRASARASGGALPPSAILNSVPAPAQGGSGLPPRTSSPAAGSRPTSRTATRSRPTSRTASRKGTGEAGATLPVVNDTPAQAKDGDVVKAVSRPVSRPVSAKPSRPTSAVPTAVVASASKPASQAGSKRTSAEQPVVIPASSSSKPASQAGSKRASGSGVVAESAAPVEEAVTASSSKPSSRPASASGSQAGSKRASGVENVAAVGEVPAIVSSASKSASASGSKVGSKVPSAAGSKIGSAAGSQAGSKRGSGSGVATTLAAEVSPDPSLLVGAAQVAGAGDNTVGITTTAEPPTQLTEDEIVVPKRATTKRSSVPISGIVEAVAAALPHAVAAEIAQSSVAPASASLVRVATPPPAHDGSEVRPASAHETPSQLAPGASSKVDPDVVEDETHVDEAKSEQANVEVSEVATKKKEDAPSVDVDAQSPVSPDGQDAAAEEVTEDGAPAEEAAHEPDDDVAGEDALEDAEAEEPPAVEDHDEEEGGGDDGEEASESQLQEEDQQQDEDEKDEEPLDDDDDAEAAASAELVEQEPLEEDDPQQQDEEAAEPEAGED